MRMNSILKFKFLNYRPPLTQLTQCRSYSHNPKQEKYMVTTPIFYVNSHPHIGHLYTATLGDAIARWQRHKSKSVLFTTGTDEHGLKIQQASERKNCQPIQLCDQYSASFRKLFTDVDISFDDFVRTTEDRHSKVVKNIWSKLDEKGYIYKGSYEGWYCVSDEAFLTDADICDGIDPTSGQPIKVSVESGNIVEWMSEENYMFRLSDVTASLQQWMETGPIRPAQFEPLVRRWLEDGLEDLSVSRISDRLSWGISVPQDPSHTIYVWLDALVNYLTVSGQDKWPADCHIVGKDILRFHAIYWPAFLIAADLPPPKSILCHSHWTKDHKKMSKSLGNIVDPCEEISKFSADGVRYFLLKEGVPHSDGSYSSNKVKKYINSDLVNTLGNLLNRSTASSLNPTQEFLPFRGELFSQKVLPGFENILEELAGLPDKVDCHYCNYEFYKGLDCVFHQLRRTNAFFQAHEPWTLKGKEEDLEWLHCIIHVTLSTLHVCSTLLEPVVPNLARKIQRRLNVPASCVNIHSHHGVLGANEGPLLQRIK